MNSFPLQRFPPPWGSASPWAQSKNYGLKPLTPWAKINLSYLRLFPLGILSQLWEKLTNTGLFGLRIYFRGVNPWLVGSIALDLRQRRNIMVGGYGRGNCSPHGS
jgi:hypothetical protein